MRAAIALSLGILATVAGCTSGTPPPNSNLGTSASVDAFANGRSACRAIQKANDKYGRDIVTAGNEDVIRRSQLWSAENSKAAQTVQDAKLRATLFGLADVVRAWGKRAPDRTAWRGYQNDFDVACHQYLTNSPPAP
jgi:hypothetical protein